MFLELYSDKLIVGWKGLKMKYLKELMPVNMDKADEEKDLEFTPENALILMKNSTVFDSWITDITSDVSVFNKNS